MYGITGQLCKVGFTEMASLIGFCNAIFQVINYGVCKMCSVGSENKSEFGQLSRKKKMS